MQTQIQAVLHRAAAVPQLNETSYIRDLAAIVVEIAQQPRMQQIVKRWQDVNELRTPDRAPVWCKPVGCWSELLPEDALLCQAPRHRQIERTLRQQLIKYDIGDDEIIADYWPVSAVIRATPGNWWGVDVGRHQSRTTGGAWAYDPPLKTADDFARLAIPTFADDLEATAAIEHQDAQILGDAMPVRVVRTPGFDSATIVCTAYANLRGLEQLMLDTLLEPELAHRLYRHITDAQLAYLDALAKPGLTDTNCRQPMLCSRAFGPQPDHNQRYSLANCWCAGNSQEFDQVSPQHFAQFLLPYQTEIFARFGRVSYGCCENLSAKMDLILAQVPNLRTLTCSAWTDFNRLLNRVGDRYCIMWRQKATDVVFASSCEQLRPAMQAKCQLLQGHYYQIVLRELETLNGDHQRLHAWTRLAIDCAERFSSAN